MYSHIRPLSGLSFREGHNKKILVNWLAKPLTEIGQFVVAGEVLNKIHKILIENKAENPQAVLQQAYEDLKATSDAGLFYLLTPDQENQLFVRLWPQWEAENRKWEKVVNTLNRDLRISYKRQVELTDQNHKLEQQHKLKQDQYLQISNSLRAAHDFLNPREVQPKYNQL